MELNGKKVVNAGVGGVKSWDYPDFSDAYFESAEYTDGTELSDEELDALSDKYPDVINEMAHETLR